MIQAYVHKEKKTIKGKMPKRTDMIATKKVEITQYQNDTKITKYKIKKENITKKVNEGAKIIKAQKAQQKLNEFEQIFNQ